MLPKTTHLQHLVLACLAGHDESPTYYLQEAMQQHGAKLKGPAFYQLMQRMEDKKWITQRAIQIPQHNRVFTHYSITLKGEKALLDVFNHYFRLKKQITVPY